EVLRIGQPMGDDCRLERHNRRAVRECGGNFGGDVEVGDQREHGTSSGLTVTHIFLLWAKDLISLADLAALRGRARERICSMKRVIGPRPSSGRLTLGMPDAPTVS